MIQRAVEATEGRLQSDLCFESLLYLNGRYKHKNGDKKNGQVYTVKSWQERKVAWPGRKWRRVEGSQGAHTVKAGVEGREMSRWFSPQSILLSNCLPETNMKNTGFCGHLTCWHRDSLFFFFSKCQNQVRQTSVTGELSPAFFISSPSELLSSALWQVL